jgi:Trypsin-co-occurring domain 2
MKLREFIAEALMEVQHGVQDAIERRDKSGVVGRISPAFRDPSDPSVDWAKLVEKVEFDVAVTESSTKEAAGGGGLEIAFIGKLDAKASSKVEHSAVNRIKFSVPVLLPAQVTHPKS